MNSSLKIPFPFEHAINLAVEGNNFENGFDRKREVRDKLN